SGRRSSAFSFLAMCRGRELSGAVPSCSSPAFSCSGWTGGSTGSPQNPWGLSPQRVREYTPPAQTGPAQNWPDAARKSGSSARPGEVKSLSRKDSRQFRIWSKSLSPKSGDFGGICSGTTSDQLISDNHQTRPRGHRGPAKSLGSFSIMLIGVPKEIKNHEYRVGMTPLSVREAVRHGHKVWVQAGAGLCIGASDEEYKKAGAQIIPTAEEIFAKADMIVKVKEPQAVERKMLREGQ